MHRMLCAREFSYREFSMRPNTGIMQRFLNGEIFSISSRSRLANERKKKNDYGKKNWTRLQTIIQFI